jgi:ribosomal protein L37AE/L43A
MSAQTRRRDCSTCKDPQKLTSNFSALGIFSCPQCNRKYERSNTEGVAADRVLAKLLGNLKARAPKPGPRK